jgi:hypothetical protein
MRRATIFHQIDTRSKAPTEMSRRGRIIPRAAAVIPRPRPAHTAGTATCPDVGLECENVARGNRVAARLNNPAFKLPPASQSVAKHHAGVARVLTCNNACRCGLFPIITSIAVEVAKWRDASRASEGNWANPSTRFPRFAVDFIRTLTATRIARVRVWKAAAAPALRYRF